MRTTLMQAFAVTVVDESRSGEKGGTPAGPPAAPLDLPKVGDVVGGLYRLVRVLGEGAFGKVYVAQRLDVPEHQVALKILPRSMYEGRNVERELVMLATVGHPHVVQLKDHGTGPDFVWLTMPVYQGETLAEREGGRTLDVVGRQLDASVPEGATGRNTVIAYEPVWAIGTGLTADAAQIGEVHTFLRSRLSARFGADAAFFRLLYGGSVKASNAAEIFGITDVDGALVGGASLRAADFSPIIEALEQVAEMELP